LNFPTFDDETDFLISGFKRTGDELHLEIEAISDLESDRRIIHAHCDKLLQYTIESTVGSGFELADRHPVLWEYQYDNASAFFRGVPKNLSAAVGAMAQAHMAAVDDWFGFTKYLNVDMSLKALLESGSGLLAQGPIPLLEVYAHALAECGIEVQIISPYPPGGRLGDPDLRARLLTESKVLLVGSSYVVGMGWDFTNGQPSG
jgi:hypothetical protein